MPPTKRNRGAPEVVARDFTELLRPYSQGWVALNPAQDRVVASGLNFEDTYRRAVEQGYNDPILIKVIPPDRGFIPTLPR